MGTAKKTDETPERTFHAGVADELAALKLKCGRLEEYVRSHGAKMPALALARLAITADKIGVQLDTHTSNIGAW